MKAERQDTVLLIYYLENYSVQVLVLVTMFIRLANFYVRKLDKIGFVVKVG